MLIRRAQKDILKGAFIDDLRIYNRTLSSDEVQQLYNEAREQLPVDDVPDNLEIKSKKLGKDNLIV